MGATFLMSTPWAAGAVPGTDARAALREWISVADAITHAGGRILLAPPAPGAAFASRLGALFKNGDEWSFLVARQAPEGGPEEALVAFLRQAGVPTRVTREPWGGQADVIALPSARYLLAWGGQTSEASLAEVRALLPRGARSLDARLKAPAVRGDEALAGVSTRAGQAFLLAYPGALADRGLPELRGFLGDKIEVVAIDEDDARAGACGGLSVNGTLLVPMGLSTGLRGQLARRGLQLVELDLPELFGKGGGGPRALVSELSGFVLSDEAPSYVSQRDAIMALAA